MTQHRGGNGPALPPIRFAELASALLQLADTLLPQWLPDGKRNGVEYVCAGLSGGEGHSLSVNTRSGAWADFATDEKGGDLLALYAAINNLTQAKAALQLAEQLGLQDVAGIVRRADGGASGTPSAPPTPPPPRHAPPPAKPRPEPEGWATLRPVPAYAPAPTFKHQYRQAQDIEHTAEYRVGADLHGYVVRFRTSDGGKETLPYTFAQSARDGAARWVWRQFDEPRPLYLPGHTAPMAGHTTVVLVEGEKKADALQALLTAHAPGVYTVASWPGGCKAWQKADWAVLAGCVVLLWPDCDAKREKLTHDERKACADEAARAALQATKPLLAAHKQPGMMAMLGIGHHLVDAHGCLAQLLQIPAPGAVPDGWDCGDALGTDGWDYARVQAFFATAQALPPAVGENAPSGPPGVPVGKKIDGPGGPTAGGLADSGADADADASARRARPRPWWLDPYWDADKSRWLVSRKLVIAALQHDEALAGVLGLNELSNNIEARRPWPWLHGKAGPITGAVDLQLGKYLSDAYGLPSINRAALMEAIETVAHESPWHPVRTYLQGLQHDGRARLDHWLIYALGEDPQALQPALARYLRLVGRYWLLGMVYRVMEPGCKFDYCPVLEGPGGLCKSTLVEVLASAPWFSDTHFDVGRGKEGQEQVQGLWVYEIAEMANFGKAEIALIKAFITAKVDRYRPSYGRVVESYPRQCVMVGTTNESTYLRDRTGNRRMWPVPVRQRINIPWVTERRDQLLAEAYALYLQGVPYTPSPAEEAELFVPVQESRLVETAVMSELLNVLTRSPAASGIGSVVHELADFVTMAQLTMALGVDAAKSNAALESQVRSWLEHEGWVREKKQVHGVRAWGYVRPRDWPPIDADAGSTRAAATQGATTASSAGTSPAAAMVAAVAEQDEYAPF